MDDSKIKKAFKAMLTLRGTKLDSTSTALYTRRLVRENEGDVLIALQKLGEAEREEFQTAVPDLATILSLVEIERVSRINRIENAKNKAFVAFECPECQTSCSGWYAPSEDLSNKRCKGIPKSGKRDDHNPEGRPVCGARLRIVHDERFEKADAGPLEPIPAWMDRSGAR